MSAPPRLVLLDRDGTLNVKPPEGEYVTHAGALRLLPGAAGAVRRLNEAGIPVAVVTNQRGVALGRMTLGAVSEIHGALRHALALEGAHLEGIWVCPHERDTCECRKPEPGLLVAAARELGVPIEEAVMIGDANSDVEAGRRAGARTAQVTATVPLAAAVDALLLRA